MRVIMSGPPRPDVACRRQRASDLVETASVRGAGTIGDALVWALGPGFAARAFIQGEADLAVAVATGEMKRILLPLDGTPSSAAAAEPALRLADWLAAELDILHVATWSERPAEPGTLIAPYYIDQPHHEWPWWAREFAERFGTALGRHRPSTEVRVFVRAGEPAEEITRFAREQKSGLIALSARGWPDAAQGGVAEAVLRAAPCPVLILSCSEAGERRPTSEATPLAQPGREDRRFADAKRAPASARRTTFVAA